MDKYVDVGTFMTGLSILGDKMSENGKVVIDQVIEMLNDFEAADVKPVVYGEWVPIYDEHLGTLYKCSACSFIRDPYILKEETYCACCGAYMNGADNLRKST